MNYFCLCKYYDALTIFCTGNYLILVAWNGFTFSDLLLPPSTISFWGQLNIWIAWLQPIHINIIRIPSHSLNKSFFDQMQNNRKQSNGSPILILISVPDLAMLFCPIPILYYACILQYTLHNIIQIKICAISPKMKYECDISKQIKDATEIIIVK